MAGVLLWRLRMILCMVADDSSAARPENTDQFM